MDKHIEQKNRYYDERYAEISRQNRRVKLCGRDIIILSVFITLYFLLNLVNFASTNAPQTFWEVHSFSENYPEYIVISIDDHAAPETIHIYKGIDEINSNSSRIKIYSAPQSVLSNGFSAAISQQYLRASIAMGNDYKLTFKWYREALKDIPQNHYIIIACGFPGVRINEIVFTGADGGQLGCTVVHYSREGERSPLNAFDEPDKFSAQSTLMSDMYFDEVYHARTAYEHILQLKPYEITHPPLGKIIIGLGIRALGMNPLGWRIAVMVFSCLSFIPVYLLGKRLFVSVRAACFMTLLFALCGLHFTLGRIATLDVLAMFFCLCAFAFMVRFYKTNMLRDKLRSALVPLAAAGIFFGLAASVKWTGIYAGAGLFVIFIVYICKTLNEFRYRAALLGNDREYKKASLKLNFDFLKTLVVCIMSFVVIPLTIYTLSYLPYLYPANPALNVAGENRTLVEVMLANQSAMLSYHGDYVVGADIHPAQSRWWEWMLNLHSVFFYNGSGAFGEGTYSRIHAVGNPVLAYGGIIALALCIYLALKPLVLKLQNRCAYVNAQEKAYKELKLKETCTGGSGGVLETKTETELNAVKRCNCKKIGYDCPDRVEYKSCVQDNGLKFSYRHIAAKHTLTHIQRDALFLLLVGYLSALVPWIFVKRSTFIYHYTPAMPFLCGIIVFVFCYLSNRYKKTVEIKLFKPRKVGAVKLAAVVFAVFAALLFAMMFPLLTGLPIDIRLADILFRWITRLGTHKYI